ALGEDLCLLVHNYQRDDIARFADAMGDSFQLSVFAKNTAAKHIVFAGVTFMAETADLVTDGQRNVVMPSMEASCPMAGMSEMVQVSRAWDRLSQWTDASRVVPVTYMNSYADLKAFTGEMGGLICTSANSIKAMKWAFERGDKVLFTPDKHLGDNTARWLGIRDEEILTWNPWDPKNNGGGLTPEDVQRAKVILWQGFCQVHERFKLEHVREMRELYPDVRIIVHPECRREVVQAADAWGSTAAIEKWVAQQPAGSTLAIGTEVHMVRRLAAQHPDKTIVQLCGPLCLDCNAMRQIDPRYLLWTLEELEQGNVVNRIRVDDEDRHYGKVAIDRMLAL
ncbi:MAG TPA: quinolinate synthase NadA, partial [Candidatus Thermoplasmatota archaeon]|nr:quinolinate synthase NadA [Candidatus Thermoplasmatota archaeon]